MSLYPVAHLHLPFTGLFSIICAFYLLRTFFFAGGAALLSKRISGLVHRKINHAPMDQLQVSNEAKSASIILLFDIFFSTILVYFNLFKHTSDSLPIYTFTFLTMFVWFEIWFYATHRLLHHPKFYFIHAQHHVARVTNPLTSLSFSAAERTVLLIGGIGFPVLLSHFLPLSFMGYASYFTVNYLLTVFAHSNVEVVPGKIVKNPVGSFLNTPTYHALHHVRHQGHYGLFTPYLDRLFKSRFSDYEVVHENAHLGHGLKLKQKRSGIAA